MSARKELFAPIPIRAGSDTRLHSLHLRVLIAVASHDRFDRNKQGCCAGHKRLAQEAACSMSHLSDALSDLRLWGYITSDRHALNRSMKVHRVIYENNKQFPPEGSDSSRIEEVTVPAGGKNSSRNDPKQFPT